MSEAGSSWVTVAPDASGFGRDLDKQISGETATVGSRIGAGFGRAFTIGAAAVIGAAAIIGIGVGSLVANGVEFNSAMENYTAAFTPLLGSAEAAKDKLAELTTFAKNTPFELTDVAGASQTLLAFGASSADLLPDLQMLGDIAQGNTEKFSGLALVYGQVQSNGHLMGQDLLQMINQGFNPLNQIAARTGESMTDLRARMAAGGISFEEVRQAMIDATSAGGQFYNTMQLASQTLTGAWSNTQDGIAQLSGAMTADLQPALVGVLQNGLNPMLSGLMDLITGAPGAQAAVTDAAQGLTAGVGVLGTAVESVVGNLGTVITAVAPALGSAVGAIVASLVSLLPSLLSVAAQLVLTLVSGIIYALPDLVKSAVPILLALVGGLLAELPSLIEVGIEVLLALVNGITAGLPTLIPQVVAAIVSSLTTLLSSDTLTALLQAGLAIILGLAQGLITALPGLIASLPAIILGIITFLIDSIPMLIDAGLELFLALVGALPDIILGIVDAIPKIITGIITAVIGAIPKLIEAGIRLLVALVENTPTIILEIIKAIPLIVGGIVGAFTDPKMIRSLADAGGQLLRGLWQGISDLGGWLWSQITGLGQQITGWVKSIFGIHSPSQVWRDEVGAQLGAGMALGLSDSAPDVAAAAAELARTAQVSLADAALSATLSGQAAQSDRESRREVDLSPSSLDRLVAMLEAVIRLLLRTGGTVT
ncbi:MAG: tape measure protein [Actinobacteria bacterium]|nr:tape measure protein [Actinomycetota bacterium]